MRKQSWAVFGLTLLFVAPMTVLFIFGRHLGFPRRYFASVCYATMALSVFIPIITTRYIRRTR
jgi:hypothetical protein